MLSLLNSPLGFSSVPKPETNPCAGQKPYHAGPGDSYFSNTQCVVDSVTQTLEQAGGNVTKGFVGLLDAKSRTPITQKYSDAGLCAVNVHWHLGAEHKNVGTFDQHPPAGLVHNSGRRLAEGAAPEAGHWCPAVTDANINMVDNYVFKHCTDMHVGYTYEIHWAHSIPRRNTRERSTTKEKKSRGHAVSVTIDNVRFVRPHKA